MIDLPLPSLGPDMESGKLLEWRVAPGQRIDKGTVIAVVDTAKAAIDVESWHAGEVIELLASPGDDIAVGTIIARLAEGSGGPGGIAIPRSGRTSPPAGTIPPRASPAARTAAASRGVDLATVRGTGPQGAITLQDVERAHAAAAARTAPMSTAATDRAVALRHAIATAMARSKREIPHYYLWDDVDMTKALAWLRETNASRPVTDRLLPACLVLAAVARAASEFGDMNGHFASGGFEPTDEVHLGVAIALRGGGLIAPALRNADTLPLDEMMRQLSDLVRRTRSGGLRSSEVAGQTLTLTHLGDTGSRGLLGVIHPPQVALVGVGRIASRAVVEQGAVVIRDVATVSLAADHRVTDGRRGAQFLGRIAALLQQPEQL